MLVFEGYCLESIY